MDREFGLIHVMVQTWFPMRKGVANLFRYREVALAANGRYLEALAVVDDPSTALKQLNAITQRKRTRAGQSVKAFNPLSSDDQRIFKALLSGQTPSTVLATGTFANDWRAVLSCGVVGVVCPSNRPKYPGY